MSITEVTLKIINKDSSEKIAFNVFPIMKY